MVEGCQVNLKRKHGDTAEKALSVVATYLTQGTGRACDEDLCWQAGLRIKKQTFKYPDLKVFKSLQCKNQPGPQLVWGRWGLGPSISSRCPLLELQLLLHLAKWVRVTQAGMPAVAAERGPSGSSPGISCGCVIVSCRCIQSGPSSRDSM